MQATEQPRLVHLLLLSSLAIIAFILVSRFISPGYFEPLVPSHSDVWRYYAYAQAPVHPDLLTSPRPLMLIMLKFLGVFSDFRLFTLGLLAPAVLAPVALVAWGERLTERRWSTFPIFVYFVLCFALESYYELQMLDFGGCLAVILGASALVRLDVYAHQQRCGSRSWGALGSTLVFVWLSMEAKPTYALVLIAAPMLYVQQLGWRKCASMCVAAGSIVFAVLVKDKLLGSPFLDTGSEDSSYRLAHDLKAVAGSFWFYVSRILPLGALPLALVGLIVLGRARGWKAPLALLALSFLAVLPMVAIPNNRLPMYAWFGASLLLLVVPLMLMVIKEREGQWLTVATVPLILGGLWAMAISEPTARYWYEYNQTANSRTLISLSSLRRHVSPGVRVLMAGAHNAFSPLKNDEFTRSRFDHDFDWRVTVPKADLSLISASRDTQRLIVASEVKPEDFDLVAYFSREGRLVKVGKSDDLIPLDTAHRLAYLLCQSELSNAPACLNQVGESEAAAVLSTSAVKTSQ